MNYQNYYKTYKATQDKLDKGYNLLQYDNEDVQYIEKPIGRAIYLNSEIEMDKPEIIGDGVPYWKQRCKCKHCGIEISKAYYAQHRRTKACQVHQKVHKKVLDIIINKS